MEESSVPLEDRVLFIEGILTQDAFEKIRGGLPQEAVAGRCVFTRYAYGTIALPKTYEIVFDPENPWAHEKLTIAVLSATQQFSIPDTTIPAGWKMICQLDQSPQGSRLLRQLPQVSSWFESTSVVGLCSSETYGQRLRLAAAKGKPEGADS